MNGTTKLNFDDLSIEEVKDYMKKYGGGGCLKLTKNQNGIAFLAINNITIRNALTPDMMVQLDDLLTELEHWDQVLKLNHD